MAFTRNYDTLGLYAPNGAAQYHKKHAEKSKQIAWVKKFIADGGDHLKAAAEYRKHLEAVAQIRRASFKKYKKARRAGELARKQAKKKNKNKAVRHEEVPKLPSRAPTRLHYRKGLSSSDFYRCWEWNTLRYQTLKRFGAVCMHCRAPGNHVDHIKPRSRYPALELDPENLQVLCEACNVGKSNLYEDDWRSRGPSSSPPSVE